MEDADVKLMLKFQAGEVSAFEELVRKYQFPVINIIYRYINNHFVAEDIAQEVFLRVYHAQRSYRPTGKFKHWLFTIVTNICLNQLRDTKRHRTISLSLEQDDSQINLADKKEKAPDYFRKLELKTSVREALNQLPVRQRLAIILNKYEGYSYEEIAKIMKLSIPAVKSILYRSRESLKEKLQKYLK